jgi:hypothetical protein
LNAIGVYLLSKKCGATEIQQSNPAAGPAKSPDEPWFPRLGLRRRTLPLGRSDLPIFPSFPIIRLHRPLPRFHVTDRLDARDWVTSFAVGWRRFDPARGRDAATVVRAFAYHGGVLALEAVLPCVLGEKDRIKANPDLSTPEGCREQAVRLAVAAHRLPEDVATGTRLFKIMLLLQENGRKRPESSTPAALLAENLDSRLATLVAGASEMHTGEVELPPAETCVERNRQPA